MVASFLVPAAVTLASEFFPMLATKLAGKHGEDVARKAIDIAAKVANMPDTRDPRTLIAALHKDPAAAEQVRYEFEKLNQAEHERILQDRSDARRYQIDIGPQGRKRGNIMLLVAAGGLALCILAVLFPADDASGAKLALVTTIAGALLKMLSDAFAFEFGSSRGSKEKDAHIEQLQRNMMTIGQERGKELIETVRDREQAMKDVARQAYQQGSRVAGQVAGQMAEAMVPRRRDFVGELTGGKI